MNVQQDSLPLDLSQDRPFRCALVEMRSADVDQFHVGLELGLLVAEVVFVIQGREPGSTRKRAPDAASRSPEHASRHVITDMDRIRIWPADGTASPSDVYTYEKLDLVITTRSEIEQFESLNDERRQRGLKGYDILCNAVSYVPAGADENSTPRRPFRLVSVGGTFNALHFGHREYLKLALRLADKVHILLASDAYARQRKEYHPRRLDSRRRSIESFVRSLHCADRVEIETLKGITDIERYVTFQNDLDLVVAEFSYVKWFDEWNAGRIRNGYSAYGMLCKSRTVVHGVELSSSALAVERLSGNLAAQIPFFEPTETSASRQVATD